MGGPDGGWGEEGGPMPVGGTWEDGATPAEIENIMT